MRSFGSIMVSMTPLERAALAVRDELGDYPTDGGWMARLSSGAISLASSLIAGVGLKRT